MFSKNNIHFKSIDSTNNFALNLKGKTIFKEGLVISTDYQFEGKGQMNNTWASQPNVNLLLSIVYEPNIKINKKFDISKIAALSICDFFSKISLKAKIKWPNDIILNNNKIAGLLIHNILSNQLITHSIIGVGINVNQLSFPHFSIPATSIRLCSGKLYELDLLKKSLLECFSRRINMYRIDVKSINEYQKMIFGLNKKMLFEINNVQCQGIIKGVDENGLLKIQFSNKLKLFNFKEIKFLF